MVDPGDTVSATLKKEFGEEAMNSLEASPEEKRKIEDQVHQLFSHGKEVCIPTVMSPIIYHWYISYHYCHSN